MGDTNIGLNTVKPGAETLRDVAPTERIALPGLGSNQQIVLAMAAEQQLGNPRALDRNLLPLDHPAGEAALLSGAVAFHFAAPPYQDQEVLAGAGRILNSFQVVGQPHTLIVAVAPRSFHDCNPAAYRAFTAALADAITIINQAPIVAAQALQRFGQPGTIEELVAQLKSPGTTWTIEPHGLLRFALFMWRTGFIGRLPSDWRNLAWPNLWGLNGHKNVKEGVSRATLPPFMTNGP